MRAGVKPEAAAGQFVDAKPSALGEQRVFGKVGEVPRTSMTNGPIGGG